MSRPAGDELAFAGLRAQSELLAARELSSRELVELSLARIEASQPSLNAFRCVRTESSLADAQAADRRLATRQSGPLLGVPVAIKDDLDLAGETTPFGCSGDFDPKREDSEAVARLKQAGAVIVGKTTTPELGQWPITEGPAFGVTRNLGAPRTRPAAPPAGPRQRWPPDWCPQRSDRTG